MKINFADSVAMFEGLHAVDLIGPEKKNTYQEAYFCFQSIFPEGVLESYTIDIIKLIKKKAVAVPS